MIVRQKKFKVPTSVLYSFGGLAFGVLTFGLALRSALVPETVPVCDTRYQKVTQFSYRAGGRLLDAPAIQARLAGTDWGLIEHATFAADSKTGVAIKIKLPEGGADGGRYTNAVSGMGYAWEPSLIKNAKSVCLSYSVWLPDGFKFGDGGMLPGLYGGAPAVAETFEKEGRDEEAFFTRMRWYSRGKMAVQKRLPGVAPDEISKVDPNWLNFETGRWVKIDQEMQLNDPGLANGMFRIFVDGKIRLRQKNMIFRTVPEGRIKGVIADTHYANGDAKWRPAPETTEIKLSPFVVRWR